MLSLATLELSVMEVNEHVKFFLAFSHGCAIMFVAHIKLIAATCDFFLFIQRSHL
jgi:hypothetical protein